MPRLFTPLIRSSSLSLNQTFVPKFTSQFHSTANHSVRSSSSKQCLSFTRQLQSINKNTLSTLSINQRSHQSNNQSKSKSTIFIAAPVAAALAALLLDESEKNQANCEAATVTVPLTPVSQSLQRTISKAEAHLQQYDTPIASWIRRALSWLIDNTIVSIMFQVVSSVCPAGQYEGVAVATISILLNAGYEIVSLVYNDGATLGKWCLGLRVQRDNYEPIDLKTATIYWCGKLLNFVLLADICYGVFNISGDSKCIHNVWSETVVVKQVKIDENDYEERARARQIYQ